MTESQHDAADALIRTTKRLRACTTTIHERVHHAFTEHPRSQRMTYCEHFKRAAWTALRLAGGAAALAVHAVFPFVLQTTGSDTVKTLHGELKEHDAIGGLKEDIPEHEGPKEDIVQELIDGLEEPLSQEDSEDQQEDQQEDSEDQQESQEESQEDSSGCESCDAHEDQVGLCEPLPQEELNEQALEEEVGAPLEQDEFSKKSN